MTGSPSEPPPSLASLSPASGPTDAPVHPLGAIVAVTAGGEAASDDSGGPARLGRRGRLTLVCRAAVLGVALVIAYGRPLGDLASSLLTNTPLAFAGLAPFAGLAVAVASVRRAPLGSARLANRGAERIVGGTLVAVAITISVLLPITFGFETEQWRTGLASLPLFAAGGVIWLFGLRACFWARHGLALLAGAAPVYYVWALGGLLRGSTAATTSAAVGIAQVSGSTSVAVGGERLLDIGGQLVTVGSACSGASSMIGWFVVGLALCPLVAGPTRRKVAWLAAGAALAFGANVARLLVLALVGRFVGAGAALEVLHPYAGMVTMVAVTVLALLLAKPLGLTPKPMLVRSLSSRLFAVAPRSWRSEGALLGVAAVGLGLVSAFSWQFDRLGGRNAVTNLSAVAVVADLAPAAGTVADLGEVDWASQYFGERAEWQRFALLREPADRGEGETVAVGIDVTTVASEANLDTYPLEACYGFHGWLIDRVAVTVLDDRPAERIIYRDGDTGTVVLSWRQRVADGYQRVVVSSQFRAEGVPGEGVPGQGLLVDGEATSGLGDTATVSALVDETAVAVAGGSWEGRPR